MPRGGPFVKFRPRLPFQMGAAAAGRNFRFIERTNSVYKARGD